MLAAPRPRSPLAGSSCALQPRSPPLSRSLPRQPRRLRGWGLAPRSARPRPGPGGGAPPGQPPPRSPPALRKLSARRRRLRAETPAPRFPPPGVGTATGPSGSALCGLPRAVPWAPGSPRGRRAPRLVPGAAEAEPLRPVPAPLPRTLRELDAPEQPLPQLPAPREKFFPPFIAILFIFDVFYSLETANDVGISATLKNYEKKKEPG